MEASFWHDCWAKQEHGFHLGHAHASLVRHASVLPSGARVLVPLCGKALDLVWLAERGHEVLGVELSELAVRAFFEEQGLGAVESALGPFKRFVAGAIEILCGDFFALEPAHAAAHGGRPIGALYDRAALVALPPEMRVRYAARTVALMGGDTQGLLIGFEYAPSVGGPPFSVPEAEVRALYEPHLEVQLLERNDILEQEPRFRARGMTALHETVYALRKR